MAHAEQLALSFVTRAAGGPAQEPPQQEGVTVETTAPPTNALFSLPSEEAEAEEAGVAVDTLFESNEMTGPEGSPRTDSEVGETAVSMKTFKSRLSKVIAQRQSAKEVAVKLLAENEGLKSVLAVYAAKYRANPALAAWDHDFSSSFEQLAKDHPDIAAVGLRVKTHMETGNDTKSSSAPSSFAHQSVHANGDAGSKSEALLNRLIRKDAEELIDKSLSGFGVKESIVRVIKRHILNSTTDIESLTSSSVLTTAREYIRDTGLTPEEVLAPAKSDGKVKKPAVGGSSRVVSGGKPAEKQNSSPKNIDEWMNAREKRAEMFAREIE